MKRMGAILVAAGAVAGWSAGASADEGAASQDPPSRSATGGGQVTARGKVAYVDPDSSGSAPIAGYNDPSQSSSRAWRHRESSNESSLDDFRIGAFGGVGFPRPLSLEGFVKIEKIIGFGVEYSVLPSVTLSGVDTTFWALAGDVRIFPFQNGFFIGMTAGRQKLGASTTLNVEPYGTLPESVTATTWFINPRVGFLSTWSWGLTLGIDAGVQIPLSASIASTIPSNLPSSVPVATDAENMARLLGKTVLPTVDLLRMGLLF